MFGPPPNPRLCATWLGGYGPDGGLFVEIGEPISLDFGIEAVSNAIEGGRPEPTSIDRVFEESSDRSRQGAGIGSGDEQAIFAGIDQAAIAL